MSDDLVKRLRDKWQHSEELCYVSADRIEKLEASLRAVVRYAGNAGDDYLADQVRKALEGKDD
jgi:hypothetical protein